MQHVDKLHPSDIPGRCAFFPQVISDPEGFVTGEELDTPVQVGGHTYGLVRQAVSVKGLREAAKRFAGMHTAEQYAELQEELSDAKAQIDQLEGELEEYDRRFTAIDVLESADYHARKKAGRPKKAAA